jgi:hypothetical protein
MTCRGWRHRAVVQEQAEVPAIVHGRIRCRPAAGKSGRRYRDHYLSGRSQCLLFCPASSTHPRSIRTLSSQYPNRRDEGREHGGNALTKLPSDCWCPFRGRRDSLERKRVASVSFTAFAALPWRGLRCSHVLDRRCRPSAGGRQHRCGPKTGPRATPSQAPAHRRAVADEAPATDNGTTVAIGNSDNRQRGCPIAALSNTLDPPAGWPSPPTTPAAGPWQRASTGQLR